MVRNVLIPIDGSENSQRAFDFYMENVRKPDDVVLLCHIQQPPSLPAFSFKEGMQFPAGDWSSKMQEQIHKSNKLMEHFEILCEEKKIAKKTILKSGKPGEAICEAAKEQHANIIVMGSRGLNTVRRTFMGSVSDYVLHHVDVPVIIVPPGAQKHDEEASKE